MSYSPLSVVVLTLRNPRTLTPSTFKPEYILFLNKAANMETERNRRRTTTIIIIMETSRNRGESVLLIIENSGVNLKKPQNPSPSTYM